MLLKASQLIVLKHCSGAEHVNVQPHSGSQANMAVYLVALNWRHSFRYEFESWWSLDTW
ncbi:hypothetical protein ACVPOQ_04505 [Staphylococcus aureus]